MVSLFFGVTSMCSYTAFYELRLFVNASLLSPTLRNVLGSRASRSNAKQVFLKRF